jgi:hypothetical protein
LEWRDYEEFEHKVAGTDYNLVKLTVRAEISKVHKTRKIVEKDIGYFDDLFKKRRFVSFNKEKGKWFYIMKKNTKEVKK